VAGVKCLNCDAIDDGDTEVGIITSLIPFDRFAMNSGISHTYL
jgi:hypothetical protein